MFAAAATAAIAVLAGLFANAILGNALAGICAAVIVLLIGFFAIQSGFGWVQVVGGSLLVLTVAAMSYAAFVFWWNYG